MVPSLAAVLGDSVSPTNPPPEHTTLEANGKKFELAHVSTGKMYRLDLRFETAYDSDPDVRVFRVDVAQSETSLATFEAQCIDKCTKTDLCVGVFLRSLQTTYHCNGLSSFGRPVGTQSVSRSWKLVGAVPNHGNAEASKNRVDLVGAVHAVESFRPTSVSFEGRTITNPSGPWLTFSTRFQRFHHVFALPLSPESCIDHCSTIATCAGIIIWEDPESTNDIMCLGVNALGTKSGIETDLNCVSITMASSSTDTLSPGGFPTDDFFGTIMLATSSKPVSGGTIAGVICGIILSVSVGLLVRWNVNRSENEDEPLAKHVLWDSNGIMWPRPKMERRGGGLLQNIGKQGSMASVLHALDLNSATQAATQPPDLRSMGKKASRVFDLLGSQNRDGPKVPSLERRAGGIIDTRSIVQNSETQDCPVSAPSANSIGDPNLYQAPANRMTLLKKVQLSVVLEDDNLEEAQEPQPQLYFAPPTIGKQLTRETLYVASTISLAEETDT